MQLTDDEWDPALGVAAGPHTFGVIGGLRSAQDEPAGWNAVVQPKLYHAHLRRLSGTLLQVDVPAQPAYKITAPETISLAIPPAALLSRRPIAASPSFVIAASRGRAFLRGAFLSNLTQESVRRGAAPFEIEIFADEFLRARNVCRRVRREPRRALARGIAGRHGHRGDDFATRSCGHAGEHERAARPA